jgi:hypothetical protein
VLGALALSLAVAAGEPPWAGASSQDLERALGATAAGGARAAAATRAFLAAPYLPSPLGEGAGRDPDPRFRLDAFDCMTLVETAVALGSAGSLDEAARALDDVRYAGEPALGLRHHEVLSQWIPANVAKGWIADVARDVAGERARLAEKVFDEASWDAVRRAGRAIRGLPASRLPAGRFGVLVVAPGDVAGVAPRLPEGTIAFVVRADAADRATRVTHAGLVVAGRGGARLVRHATSSRGLRRVIDEPIALFVKREGQALPRWPLEGLAFYAVRDNRARLRGLTPAPPAREEAGEPSPARPPGRL